MPIIYNEVKKHIYTHICVHTYTHINIYLHTYNFVLQRVCITLEKIKIKNSNISILKNCSLAGGGGNLASLNHAPPCCVTTAGMLPSLNLSVLKWGRDSKGLGQRRSWKV